VIFIEERDEEEKGRNAGAQELCLALRDLAGTSIGRPTQEGQEASTKGFDSGRRVGEGQDECDGRGNIYKDPQVFTWKRNVKRT
jgi:hypothetical protein